MEYCMRQTNIVYDLISKKRTESEFLKLFNNAIGLTKKPKVTRNMSNSELNYKILYYEILDNILLHIITRFQNTNKFIFLRLDDVSKFKYYSNVFPENAFENLGESYSDIFHDKKKKNKSRVRSIIQ